MLNICVEISQEVATAAEIRIRILSRWPEVSVISSSDENVPSGVQGLLVLGEGGNRSKESLLLVEKMILKDLDQEQIMFQIGANLGKMLASDLIKTKAQAKPFDKNAEYSRRDLFSGIRSMGNLLQSYTDAPLIYNEICESKYGCSKCVESCPTHALSIVKGSVVLNEQECSRIGLCTAVCPVSAIQLPRYSESKFLGLVRGVVDTNPTIPKTLVLTCDKNSVPNEPWMFVEQVKDVGIIGSRHLSIAASSGIDRIIVYCADGSCSGKEMARGSVESFRNFLGEHADGSETIIARFLVGEKEREEISRVHKKLPLAKAKTLFIPRGDAWDNYIDALKKVAPPHANTIGLGLTTLRISESCTLCQVCENYCPHSALRVVSESLELDSSKCTGCGYCVKICPEHSIELDRLENISDLENREVFHDEIVNCERCNRPLGSAKYMRRIKELLGKDDPMTKYCNACKQQIAVERMLGNKR